MAEYSREACLAWLVGAGLSPEEQKSLLLQEPDPLRLFAAWQRDGAMPETGLLSKRGREALTRNRGAQWMDAAEQLISRHGIRAMSLFDPSYPERLRVIPQAPAVLFWQGSLEALDGHTAAMIGSRSASLKGLEACRKIAAHLSRGGVRIVSGLAYGIDAAAHTGCLEGGSPTVAVLGCGLDRDYPAENAPLRRSLLEKGGLVISEYAPGEKPLSWHFPFRNRIISGLGDCTVLMEATIRSGSMTTVQHALDQGKDVFVYPGDPDSPKFEGNRQLLREGGIYFTSAEDLMEDMRWLDKRENVGHNKPGLPEEGVSLSLGEKQLLKALEAGEQSFDELCASLGFSASQLSTTLSMLQIRGLVRALPGKIYQRNM